MASRLLLAIALAAAACEGSVLKHTESQTVGRKGFLASAGKMAMAGASMAMSMMGKDDKDADPRPADLSNGWEDDSMAEKLHALPGYYTDPGGINPMMSETDHVASQKEFWRFVTRRKTDPLYTGGYVMESRNYEGDR